MEEAPHENGISPEARAVAASRRLSDDDAAYRMKEDELEVALHVATGEGIPLDTWWTEQLVRMALGHGSGQHCDSLKRWLMGIQVMIMRTSLLNT
jgi:hypothetical protein